VPQHEAIGASGTPAVLAFDDLDVRAADPDRDRLDEHRSISSVWLRKVLESGAPGFMWHDSDCFHAFLPRSAIDSAPAGLERQVEPQSGSAMRRQP